ncbi:MAG: hypothetical protein H6R46_730, partial [Proteobacteria bacterium]|nr:hypothetical protein [Pseudomonadota bacterium]
RFAPSLIDHTHFRHLPTAAVG